jgi:hypothetical protein
LKSYGIHRVTGDRYGALRRSRLGLLFRSASTEFGTVSVSASALSSTSTHARGPSRPAHPTNLFCRPYPGPVPRLG